MAIDNVVSALRGVKRFFSRTEILETQFGRFSIIKDDIEFVGIDGRGAHGSLLQYTRGLSTLHKISNLYDLKILQQGDKTIIAGINSLGADYPGGPWATTVLQFYVIDLEQGTIKSAQKNVHYVAQAPNLEAITTDNSVKFVFDGSESISHINRYGDLEGYTRNKIEFDTENMEFRELNN